MKNDNQQRYNTYSHIFYYDENRNACAKEDAYSVHILEYDEKGVFIQETIGFVEKNPEL